MRLRSLLIPLIVASAGCGAGSGRDAAFPDAPAQDPAQGAPDKTALAASPDGRAGANPTEVVSYPEGTEGAPPALPTPITREERYALIAGVAFTTMGCISATVGGVFLGMTGGACNSSDPDCPERIAFPIVGSLWIAASVIPLVLGVSIWAPRPSPSAPPSKTPAWNRPEVRVGPAGASVRFQF
jgi:hypothetical protein